MNARNQLRWRAVNMSRDWKALARPLETAGGFTERVLIGVMVLLSPWRWRRIAYRLVFTTDGTLRRVAADHVLADLRDYAFARTSAFDPDPIIMARRQGRRDVWLRISNYLNLDEAQVQTLMEIDDGI